MARIEKTVFISYRRTDVYTALAVYENLKNQGYDVFFDYRSISSGDFEQIITSNIRARAHFLLILTPTALDRSDDPGDWLRREIEIAIDEKRNIVPLFFKGFRFGIPSVSDKLTAKLKNLSRYNGLNVHEDYFEEAMNRLRTQYLNIPLETVLHPVSTEVLRVVREEQVAADEALEQIEDVQELAKQGAEKTELDREQRPKPVPQSSPKSRKSIPWRPLGLMVGGTLLIGFLTWGAVRLLRNLSSIDSTKISDKDGMTLLYVPAGEFRMGSRAEDVVTECLKFNSDCQLDWFKDEEPPHDIYLDAFWMDQTEVTNKMYSSCAKVGACEEPLSKKSSTYSSYYGNAEFDNYPVIYVDWNMAKTYCEWAGRRLPTEAEWEKAARGTDQRLYPWSNEFDGTRANFCDKSCSLSGANQSFDDRFAEIAPVGSYLRGASPYGALDMAGNVWEWVNDWYSDTYYSVSPPSNPIGPNSGEYRVVRGGSWNYNDDDLRTASRIESEPMFSNYDLGFRCAQTATLGVGSIRISETDSMKLVYIPMGEFTMGGKTEDALMECRRIPSDCRWDWHELGAPPHQVSLDAFWIDETEVTNAMYAKCVQDGTCDPPDLISSFTHENYYGNSEFDNYPVIYVSWDDAKAYCAWAGRRLPMEAEWEKAARGVNAFFYPWGTEFDSSLVNFCDTNCPLGWADKTRDDGFADTAPVGNYSNGASSYGALNMVGNVWEWVHDLYSNTYYTESPSLNPLGPESGQFRVLRGGSWDNLVNDVRAVDRYQFDPSQSGRSVGFRCAVSAAP